MTLNEHLVEAFTDPEVSPLPPHLTFKQVSSFTKSMLKGDPRSGGMLRQTSREALAGFKHHHH